MMLSRPLSSNLCKLAQTLYYFIIGRVKTRYWDMHRIDEWCSAMQNPGFFEVVIP
jgi:hypothetical protein